ncbi:substrate-binding periplasmic protein [Oceanicoccus sagamiensis]|uniref:Solute-binding protein family 3/N-terminal domain-containing protein n=1 Tax=Oceanicoccus sagamiensis TaxID=716816 RepID=A0A1X9NJG1_9GAMM|nr:transporter substrate-binding domain-containing protein [Oceanicoccus sagamiensis]ARN75017.1 hypothetical protein BST96_13380 [Oceanicoccus sagamiensis]
MSYLYTFTVQIALLFTLASTASAQAEEPLKVIVTAAGKPWSYIDDQGKPQGISRELMGAVFDDMAVPVNYKALLYTRALHSLKTGKADVMALTIGSTQSIQPPPDTYVSPAPVGNIPLSIYKLASRDLTIQTPRDLANYRVGLVRVEKQPAGQADNVFYYPRNEFLFKALAKGKIDFAIGALYFDHVWSEKFEVEIERLLQIDTLNIYIAFSSQTLGEKKAASLCRDYFLTNKKLSNNGKLEQLLLGMDAPDLVPHLKITDKVENPDCVTQIAKDNTGN